MIKKIAALLFICLPFLICVNAAAQTQQNPLLFNQLTTRDGLLSNITTTLYQDSRYFLWIGTNHGLIRYDGKFFTNYNQIGEGGITDRVITCITEDADGNIWIGTESGLNKLNPKNNQITQYRSGSGPGTIPFHWCNYLFTDSKKQLWLTTEKGIALYDKKTDSFENIPISVYGKDEKINKFINQVAEDEEGNFWLSTSFGLKKFNPSTKQFYSYHLEEPNNSLRKENVLYGLCVAKPGSIWAVSFEGHLLHYESKNNRLKIVSISSKEGPRLLSICTIKQEKQKFLLIATSDGIFKVNPDNPESPPQKLLSGKSLNKVFTDKQNNLWISSENGLFRQIHVNIALQWHDVPDKDKPLINHIIRSTLKENIYFLTSRSGWFTYNSNNDTVTFHTLPADDRGLLTQINRHVGDENGYWFTSTNGFGYYDLKKNRLIDLTRLITKVSSQQSTGFIEEPLKGQLWITMRRSGILVYNTLTGKDTVLFADKQKADNIYGKTVFDFKKGPDNNIWFTTDEKLYVVNPVTYSYKTYKADNNIFQNNKTNPYRILFTKDGRALINSQSNIYEFKNQALRVIHPKKGLFNFELQRLLEDETGNIWAVTDNGIYKTNNQFSYWKNISNAQGFENETAGYEINLSVPGKVMITSVGKIGVLDNKLMEQSRVPNPSIISRIRLGNTEAHFPVPALKYKCDYKDAVEIELTSPDFSNESENSIYYRLEGWDDEWRRLSTTNTIRYEQLPPGNYLFSTKSVNTESIESRIAFISFKVVPPFYRSWWFIVLSFIIIISIAYLFYRYHLHKAIELEKIRTRIATDLHDDIGATLSSISMYSDALKLQVKDNMPQLESVLTKMGESSREMVTGMSDIVWAINPDNDSGEKLLNRMENYVTDMCAVKNIKLFFKADEKLKQIRLPLEKRKNIYLVFKEAVNNAVKYSMADHLWVTVNIGAEFSLLIKDDGAGFTMTDVKKGNGLKNFKTRADEIKGKIQINSMPGAGTSVKLICQL